MTPAIWLAKRQLSGLNTAAERDRDLALLWRNLKGPRDKDLMATAEALQRRRADPEFPTLRALAKVANVAPETIRQFLAILKLPVSVQDRFRRGELRSLEKGYRLSRLQQRRKELVEPVAELMTRLSAHQSRALVDYLIRHANSDISGALEATGRARTRVETRVNIIAELSEDDYRALRKLARRHRVNEVELVTRVVRDWLANERPDA